jgi:hypothetical protein
MREGVRDGKKHNYDGDICRGDNRVGHTVTAVSNLGNDRNAGRGPTAMVIAIDLCAIMET